MPAYVALLRGLNVGGRNPVGMADLAACFEDAGYLDVRTYIQSGNVLFTTDATGGPALETEVERMLEDRLEKPILAVVRSRDELAEIVAAAPPDHGSQALRSDVLFLKHPLTPDEVLAQMPDLREGVDEVAAGPGVVYFSRVAARATETRFTRFMGMPVFRRITMRNWRTTTRLLELLDGR
ncbi:uncharacterized protein (DUF1697 family) [Conyzicola nivalis]|uniref:Uncharacterized protein (DUF1697 family) n=1 Tax=Conyzicola nivalis TaxID=1477021 RepID=A0ABV2QMJ5_9MICO